MNSVVHAILYWSPDRIPEIVQTVKVGARDALAKALSEDKLCIRLRAAGCVMWQHKRRGHVQNYQMLLVKPGDIARSATDIQKMLEGSVDGVFAHMTTPRVQISEIVALGRRGLPCYFSAARFLLANMTPIAVLRPSVSECGGYISVKRAPQGD